MNACAFVLAAGRGRRSGGPKAWQAREGRSLIEKQAHFLLGLFSPELIFFSIQKEWLGRCRKIHPRINWVAVDPDAPAMASFLTLLRISLPEQWIFFHHVDMPVWSRGLFRTLMLEASRAGGEDALIACHKGQRGHPALLAPHCGPALLKLNPFKDRLDYWLKG